MSIDLAGDVALQDADDFALGAPLLHSALEIGFRVRVVGDPHHDDAPQCAVGLAVTATVETMSCDPARGRLDGRHAAEMGPGRLRPQPIGVVAGSDEQGGGRVRSDASQRQQLGRGGEEEGPDELVEAGDFDVEEPDSMGQARDRGFRP